jgi:hypothetical protein
MTTFTVKSTIGELTGTFVGGLVNLLERTGSSSVTVDMMVGDNRVEAQLEGVTQQYGARVAIFHYRATGGGGGFFAFIKKPGTNTWVPHVRVVFYTTAKEREEAYDKLSADAGVAAGDA